MKTKAILLNLDPQDYENLHSESSKLGLSMSAFLRLLIRQWSDGITFSKDKNNHYDKDN